MVESIGDCFIPFTYIFPHVLSDKGSNGPQPEISRCDKIKTIESCIHFAYLEIDAGQTGGEGMN